MARLLLVRIQASKKRPREETKPDIRKRYEALVREKQRHTHRAARGEHPRSDNTDRDATALARELGNTDIIAKAVADADDFATVRRVERTKAEMTAILTGKAKHLVVQRMWKGADRDGAKLW
eukprot:2427870-Rhodomonas_salina.1